MNLFQNALISFKWCVSINYYFSRFRDICTCLVCISNRVHLSNSYRASSISCNPVQKARLIPVQEPIRPKYSLLIPLHGRGVMLCLFFLPTHLPSILWHFLYFLDLYLADEFERWGEGLHSKLGNHQLRIHDNGFCSLTFVRLIANLSGKYISLRGTYIMYFFSLLCHLQEKIFKKCRNCPQVLNRICPQRQIKHYLFIFREISLMEDWHKRTPSQELTHGCAFPVQRLDL